MVGRIYHVGLTVSDLDRSIAFYRDIPVSYTHLDVYKRQGRSGPPALLPRESPGPGPVPGVFGQTPQRDLRVPAPQ